RSGIPRFRCPGRACLVVFVQIRGCHKVTKGNCIASRYQGSGSMSGVGLALSMAGMAALSLGMDKHHEQVFGDASTMRRTRLFKLLGWLLLALAVIPCVQVYG